MTKTKSGSSGSQQQPSGFEDSAQEDVFHTFTAEEAQAWRASQPVLSVWWVLVAQLSTATVLGVGVGWWFGRTSLLVSWIYGALSVILPAALFARGLKSPTASINAASAALSFAVWQGVKMVLNVLWLVLAPRFVDELSWPALLAGLIVTMKMYWLALVWGKPRSAQKPSTPL
jgi:ATP synthase protein I